MTRSRPLIGTIYFIRQKGTDGPIKIGASRRSGLQRLEDFQPGCPVQLELAGAINGSCREEKLLHRLFDEHRLRNEWFSYHPDMEIFIGKFGGVLPPPGCLHSHSHTADMYANYELSDLLAMVRGVQVPELEERNPQ